MFFLQWRILVFYVVSLFIMNVLGRVRYTKTYGDIIEMADNTRYPERYYSINCLSKCNLSPGCYCARVSTESQFSTCETFNNEIDINTFNKSGYLYYAVDRYKDTVGKESIALRKPAHQSSIYELKDVKYSADKAVDGFRHVDGFTKPYFAHTDDSNTKANRFPWWQVDLKDEYVITGVNVLNRKLWAERLHDFEIRVGNERLTPIFRDKWFTANVLCAEHLGAGIADNETVKFLCSPCPVKGRYVSIQIVRFCAKCAENNMNVLQLAEVDVFGYKADN